MLGPYLEDPLFALLVVTFGTGPAAAWLINWLVVGNDDPLKLGWILGRILPRTGISLRGEKYGSARDLRRRLGVELGLVASKEGDRDSLVCTRFSGVVESRAANVRFTPCEVWLAVAAPRAPRFDARRGASLLHAAEPVVTFDDDGRDTSSKLERTGVKSALERVFGIEGVARVLVRDRELAAEAGHDDLSPRAYRRVLGALAHLAAVLEDTGNRLTVSAAAQKTEEARCAYCHDDASRERDRVACDTCGVLLHARCWIELGRCPSLGCKGVRRELSKPVARIVAPKPAGLRKAVEEAPKKAAR